MSKKVIITEEQFKHLINEELGIVNNVVKITKLIQNEVFKALDKGKDITFNINDLKVVFKIHNINSIEELYEKYGSGEIKDGYSYNENAVYISYINFKDFDRYEQIISLKNTIQHEVEHYWQCKNANKSFVTKQYNNITNGLYNDNPIISTICKILYYAKHIEIDANVNGAYNELENLNITTYDEFIEKTTLSKLFNVFKENGNALRNWNINSFYFFDAVNYIKKNRIIGFETPEQLLDKLYNIFLESKEYLIRKCARAYTLYVKNNEINNIGIEVHNS